MALMGVIKSVRIAVRWAFVVVVSHHAAPDRLGENYMTANDCGTDNGSVSKGDIVQSPEGERWIVIDPDDDLNGEDFHWLESVTDDAQRGIGKRTFHNENWEVLE